MTREEINKYVDMGDIDKDEKSAVCSCCNRNNTMKLLIDIPENVRIAITRMGLLRIPDDMQKEVDKAIQSGTPLPKGHGGLITKEQAIELVEFYQINPQHFDFVNLIEDIKDEKPIIPAYKEE